jgi:hypothetical protein
LSHIYQQLFAGVCYKLLNVYCRRVGEREITLAVEDDNFKMLNDFGVLTPLSAILQLFHGDQF